MNVSVVPSYLFEARIRVRPVAMLRRSLSVGPEWIAATSAGLAVGLAIGAIAVGYETTTSQLAIMGAIQGAFVGIAQGMVLRNKFSL